MDVILLALTGAVLIAAMLRAYVVTRDALHPLIFLGPMLLYQYVVRPWLLAGEGAFEELFADPSQLEMVLLLNLLGVGLLCHGCLVGARHLRGRTPLSGPSNLGPAARRQLYALGCLLGAIALASFLWTVGNRGGLWAAYGHVKGGGYSSSGYINEAQLLAYPGIVLLALARSGRRARPVDWLLILLFAGPQLFHGIIGARRGPTFRVLATLVFSWLLIGGRRPSPGKVVAGVCALCVLAVFLVSQRSEIYLGSDFNVDMTAFYQRLFPEGGSEGDEFVVSAGHVIMASETGEYYWGARYAVTYLVRPIPKQLWPTKYEDMGLGWVRTEGGSGGFAADDWKRILNWRPPRGSSAGFVADLFIEFSWAGLALCWALGRFYGYLWEKASLRKGVWCLFYIEAAILSVYVPTQSVSAVFYRFLFMGVPTLVLWRLLVRGRSSSSAGAAARGAAAVRAVR